jgi:DMSO/TMAO reductase YedYZ molybdopterin-dependent catalytic subunit
LEGTLAASGLAWLGCSGHPDDPVAEDAGVAPACQDRFAGGTLLGKLAFTNDGSATLNHLMGSGLDGRLYTDLSSLSKDGPIVPNERFYVRTRYPDLLDPRAPWTIAVKGLVGKPLDVALGDLRPQVVPMGVHVLECSGNGTFGSFGLLGAAAWSGIPIRDLLSRVDILPTATRALVSGFDQHSSVSGASLPGASWIFTLEELAAANAFLATEMNGVPLPKDHGDPVRLYVPGWYGCTCVKWVNEIVLVDETAKATSHMQEFAARTHQDGVPTLARDFRSASMDQAAMPIRVEKWRVDGAILYRVVGVLWGGYAVTDALAIRFRESEPFVPVELCPKQSTYQTWTFWEHTWAPTRTGAYDIALQIDDPSVPTRRLDTGFYVRSVEVDEV